VHRHIVSAVRAFNQVSEPADLLRFVMQMYLSVAEGDVARVGRLTLHLLGQCHLAKVDHGLLEVLAFGVLPARPLPGRHDRRLWHRLGWWLAAV
jgi:hypothetical protein